MASKPVGGGIVRNESGARWQRLSFFPLFGVSPILGRGLEASDAQPGNDHVVVLGYGLWQRYFAADRAMVGRNIPAQRRKYTVVGVMPPTFRLMITANYGSRSPWGVPTHPLAPEKDPRRFRDRNYLDVWARLKPGVTTQQARAQLDTIARRLEKEYPDSNAKVGVSFLPLHDYVVGDIRPVLFVLLAAVAVVLLICCANVANLLLARATARAREMSIRTTIGASRGRLLRQLLTESVLLALVGGLLGLLLAVITVPSLLALSPPDIQEFNQIGINREVLAFSFLASMVCGVIFGLIPALQGSQSSPSECLKEGERGSTANRGRTRSALVIAEVGLSLTLLIGSGLLVKSFARLMDVDPGFDPDRLLTFSLGFHRPLILLINWPFTNRCSKGFRRCQPPRVRALSAGFRWREGTVHAASTPPEARTNTPRTFASAPPIIFARWEFHC